MSHDYSIYAALYLDMHGIFFFLVIIEYNSKRLFIYVLFCQTKNGNTWYCEDKYMFVTPARCKYDKYFKSGKHSCDIQNWESPLEEEFVSCHFGLLKTHCMC